MCSYDKIIDIIEIYKKVNKSQETRIHAQHLNKYQIKKTFNQIS